ncbi:TPA: DNA-binding protein [Stenotrophomonas maltophilia]|jgi:gp16 family phage-associated protein|uniref:DNA-binding protein n=1 Tax=Stenotrophomonas TaxID=40323 RepID=UPI0009B288AB|nr:MULTISPECIES: DNA-binding protein [Stenotrophomonas]EMB2831416.1 DNA-binding protein [Stenotrophomonas maltophilia]MBH1412064.1 DNA-binding protein [Stenotrophomonas maltophilia]MBH1453248.1 DNA-binding protein [Stenotrophomonas maltophilia]MBH1529810.1 DNA-binding protein [Stenotrophomonas maltophilia]MBH1813982.1 DNA-binding protein [Stenotrophomonas maltophilia]
MSLKTGSEVRRHLLASGISISEWSRSHGFNRHTVVDLLRGKRKGNFGEAHLAAIALGMKAGPKDGQR